MTPQITAIYAAMLGLIMIGLSAYVSAKRAKIGVSIGDGGDPALLERIRRHGNFTEVVPMALLLMALAEMLGAGNGWIHAAGIILLAARLLHPIGIMAGEVNSLLRFAGSMGTFVAMLIAIVAILRSALGF